MSATILAASPDVRSIMSNSLRCQLRTSAHITLLGPAVASLILLVVDYFEYWRTAPLNLADALTAFYVFALPVGYVFGCVPALLAALLHGALLAANTKLAQLPWVRACTGALCGGLVCWIWFGIWSGTARPVYALVGALVMAAVSSFSPKGQRVSHTQR